MDAVLIASLLDRDWPSFVAHAQRLGLGQPQRTGTRLDLIVTAPGTTELFRPVLLCEDYDAAAPLLDFADVEAGESLGGQHWPRMSGAPYNEITYAGRRVPILCTPGTLGYHLHPSHHAEVHDKSVWTLARQASLISRLMTQMGTYQGRGV